MAEAEAEASNEVLNNNLIPLLAEVSLLSCTLKQDTPEPKPTL